VEAGFVRGSEWAHLGSNQGPLACEASALPLSYAPGSGCKRSTGAGESQLDRSSQNAYPFATNSATTVEATKRKGEPVDGIETNAPHHQLLHLVEAAQLAGFSEREIVQIVEAELDTDAELDQAA
jgi:hypothetical protein